MAAANQTETALLTVLRMAGLSLSIDANREAVLSGSGKALAVWHALAAAIDQLDVLIIAGLDGEAMEETPPSVVELDHLEVVAPTKPVRPKLPPGPRSGSGIPYLDGRALAWRARRDLARQFNIPFEEPPPYSWEDT
jgi:hypothetical protein